VLLGSPLAALGAFFGVGLAGYDNNVHLQISLVVVIGLAAKDAILIVEVAKGATRGGHADRGGVAGGGAPPVPAHPHDGLRRHPGRGAPRARQ
jgi:hypothetical protein